MACSAAPTKESVAERTSSALAAGPSLLRAGNRYGGLVGDAYVDTVQPILGQRCAVCHSCTNGPCQLNMTSYAAIVRGISSTNPYEFGVVDKRPTRISDNLPVAAWRAQGFRSVLPDGDTKPSDSVFFRSLELGERNVVGTDGNDGALSLATARALAQTHDRGDYACPANADEYSRFARRAPLGGMPWGLPALAADEHGVVESWVLAGAPGPSAEAQRRLSQPERTTASTEDPQTVVADWEAFFGGDDRRSQLVARYVYEHAFQANVHFEESPGEFYRIVRSRTAAPAAIDRIVTDTPMDDPGVPRVHYRLEKIDRLIEGKTHVVWRLSRRELARFRELFFTPVWDVARLPGYRSKNPFEDFEAIPAVSRARFMIENARMIYQSFARGPICMIQMATYAVDEHFWIWFLKPESDPTVLDPRLGLDSYAPFFSKEGNLVSGVPILGDKYGEPKYRAAFEATLRRMKPQGLGLDDVWDGDGTNPNAWLTLHRHQVSTDVTTGAERPLTGMPRSVWLISYANFERMYYNAAATYRYWGNLKHQNDTFVWQIYTRTEAEDLYASLFADESYREGLRDQFTSWKGKVYNKLFTNYAKGRPSRNPELATEAQLARAMTRRMGPGVLVQADRLNPWADETPPSLPATVTSATDFEVGLRGLTARARPVARFIPNIVHVRLAGEHLYTLLADRGYHNDKIAIGEPADRHRERDHVVAVPGFSGFEAHLFVDLTYENAGAFLRDLASVSNLDEWRAVRRTYGIGRTSTRFWPFVDWLHGWMNQHMPVEAGLLELRFYDKDEMPF